MEYGMYCKEALGIIIFNFIQTFYLIFSYFRKTSTSLEQRQMGIDNHQLHLGFHRSNLNSGSEPYVLYYPLMHPKHSRRHCSEVDPYRWHQRYPYKNPSLVWNIFDRDSCRGPCLTDLRSSNGR